MSWTLFNFESCLNLTQTQWQDINSFEILTASSVVAASSPGHGVDSCSFSNMSYTKNTDSSVHFRFFNYAQSQQDTLVAIQRSAYTSLVTHYYVKSCQCLVQPFLTAMRFLDKVMVTVTIEPAVMLLLSSSSRTAETQKRKGGIVNAWKSPYSYSRECMQNQSTLVEIILNLNWTDVNPEILKTTFKIPQRFQLYLFQEYV